MKLENYRHGCTQNIESNPSSCAHAHSNSTCSSSNMDEDASTSDTDSHFEQNIETDDSATSTHDTTLERNEIDKSSSTSTTSTRCSIVAQEELLCDESLSSINCICNHRDVNHDIVVSVIKAFQLMEDMDGSQKNFLDILKFAKDIYCSFKGDTDTIKKWQDSWYACNVILKNSGYKEPITHYICRTQHFGVS